MKENLNCLLMQVKMILVLYMLVWKLDHLGQYKIARVIPEMQKIEFKFWELFNISIMALNRSLSSLSYMGISLSI